MTATQTAAVEAPQAVARVAPVAAGVRMRRRPALVAVSVALVVLGALLSVWAYSSLGSAQPVVGVRQDVARGSVISASDLEVVRVGVDPALATVPADRLETLVGQRAAVDLQAGQLMVPTGVTQDVAPHKGMSVVGSVAAAAGGRSRASGVDAWPAGRCGGPGRTGLHRVGGAGRCRGCVGADQCECGSG